MNTVKAALRKSNIICMQSVECPFPYLLSNKGDKEILCHSPLHGRSFVVGRTENGRYIVSKGNGLSFTQHTFLHTGEFYDGTWGLLWDKRLRHLASKPTTWNMYWNLMWN